jgi:GntR family transcriptional regulator
VTNPDRWVSVSTDYVRPRATDTGDAWREEAARQGRTGSNTLREVAEVRPSADIAKALGLAQDEMAIVRRRVVLLDGQPIELTDSYYPPAIARGTALAELRKVRGGAVTLLNELGYAIVRVHEDVSARMPTSEERELLQMDDDQPVLVVVRLAMSTNDVPIEVTVMTIADDRHLRYELAT